MRFNSLALVVATTLAAALVNARPFTPAIGLADAAQLYPRQAVANDSAPDPTYLPDVPIHESCNGTQRAQIEAGLEDMKRLATEARSYVIRGGNQSELFVKYFGAAADPAPVIGYLTAVIEGDKTGTLLRCDDPDGNCAMFPDYYAGHWRGENATQETVICDLTYRTRRSLNQVCALGFEVANSNSNLIFGADLMHRLFHIPKVSNEKIIHLADPYIDCIDLAKTAPEHAVANQHSLQFFALDVWSHIITPGGCVGEPVAQEAEAAAATASSSAAPAPAASSAAATDGKECHSHSDGTVHCE